MPFSKGQSGNPGGKRKRLALSRAVRASEGLKTWAKLLQIRDQKGLEAKEVREVCKLLLAYCWGLPIQQADGLEDRIKILEKRVRELTVTNGFHGNQYAS